MDTKPVRSDTHSFFNRFFPPTHPHPPSLSLPGIALLLIAALLSDSAWAVRYTMHDPTFDDDFYGDTANDVCLQFESNANYRYDAYAAGLVCHYNTTGTGNPHFTLPISTIADESNGSTETDATYDLSIPDPIEAIYAEADNEGLKSCPNTMSAAPINLVTGNKYFSETDFVVEGVVPFAFQRRYNSFTGQWRHTLGQSLSHQLSTTVSSPGNVITTVDDTVVIVHRPDGQDVTFNDNGQGQWVASPNVSMTLDELPAGWQLNLPSGVVEEYDDQMRLTRITEVSGYQYTLVYDASGATVTGSDGIQLVMELETDGRLKAVTTPGGQVYKYQYSQALGSNDLYRLTKVIYPDDTPLDDADNPFREYLFEDTALSNAITGIIDERGVRYANVEYDDQARASASYLGPQTAILADRLSSTAVEYDPAAEPVGTRYVSNARGATSTYATFKQLGIPLVSDIQGPGCTGCSGGDTSYTYDASNNKTTESKFGITTKFGNFTSRGEVGCRVIGVNAADTSPGACDFDPVASPDARRIDYTYDARFYNQIATRTEPSVLPGSNQLTTYTYDNFGNLLTSSINGFTPTGTPVSRTTTWQYTGPYHQLSQIDGPRTDITAPASKRWKMQTAS
jgi:YD repeat-containing protein